MRYFNLSDFNCKETGENAMNEDFLVKLDELRHLSGFPFIVTSGYRSKDHSIEAKKVKGGTHTQGIAADIRAVGGHERYVIQKNAYALGFKGIGVHEDFIHVDTRQTISVSWPY